MSARFRSEESTKDVQWLLDYFETDASKLATSLFSLLDASHEMEKAFFRSFEDRLKLDATLVKMRTSEPHPIESRTLTETALRCFGRSN